jgi:exodeoxyribonuclease VII large subunit
MLASRLELLNPKRTLERGYAVLLDAQDGCAVRAPEQLKLKRRFMLHLAQGTADIVLADIQPHLDDNTAKPK